MPRRGPDSWRFDPKAYEDGQPPPNGTGFVHRGVAAWRDGESLRIFMNSRCRLICLDAATGKLVPTFGDGGIVDLSRGLVWGVNEGTTRTRHRRSFKDLVIVGNGVADRPGLPQRSSRRRPRIRRARAVRSGASARFRRKASSATTRGGTAPGNSPTRTSGPR